uniref:Uncharacterized protein n=1 Tax=Erpetoichthys calabaricus TaxID=27687 RepID=A0A8C4X961_ERPCA
MSLADSNRAARLLLCKLLLPETDEGKACLLTVSWLTWPGVIIPVHLLICFWRYFLWFTFLLDLTGLSSASLMLLEAVSIKLNRSLVVSLNSPSDSRSPRSIPSYLPHLTLCFQLTNCLYKGCDLLYNSLLQTEKELRQSPGTLLQTS